MKKGAINIIIILLLSFGAARPYLYAQPLQGQRLMDSLAAELKKAKDDTNKVNILKDMSYQYARIAPDTSLIYGKECLALAVKLDWEKGKAISMQNIGRAYYYMSDYPHALENYNMAIKIFREIKDKKGIASASTNIGIIYANQSDYPAALKLFLESLRLYEEIGDKKGASSALGNIGNIHDNLQNYSKALEYFFKALKIDESTGDKRAMTSDYSAIGGAYGGLKNPEESLKYYFKSLRISEEIGSKYNIANSMTGISSVYATQGKYNEALDYSFKAMKLYEEMGNKRDYAYNVANVADMHIRLAADTQKIKTGPEALSGTDKEHLSKAIYFYEKAAEIFREVGAIDELQRAYGEIYKAQKLSGNYRGSLESYENHVRYRDSVFNKENTEKMARLEVESEYEKRQLADSIRNAEARKLSAVKLQRQQVLTFSGVGAAILLLAVSLFISRNNKKLTIEKQRSESLLLNILPSEVADELKDRGATTARHFDSVTVLFTDFVNFTMAGERMGSEALVDELHNCFKAFDEIIGKHGIEKIKTIGDAYLAVCGLPVADTKHVEHVVNAALEITSFMKDRRTHLGDKTFEVRVGIHSGDVVAGIVGVKKFAYDIWGDTVNTAARMEQNSLPGKINISQTTYDLVKDKFTCVYRGEIEAKNKGMLKMYFVEG